jgi:hypothetical protein
MPLQTTYASPPQHQRDLRPLPGGIPTDSKPTSQAHEKPRLVEAGLDKLDVRTRTQLEIPGYFRSEKKWDLLVVTKSGGMNRLVLAIELKSMAGSTGKNLNNRAEEIIGNAVDLWDRLQGKPLRLRGPSTFRRLSRPRGGSSRGQPTS